MSHPFFGQEYTFTQPDGSKFKVRGVGDHRRGRFATVDGVPVVNNQVSGFYEFAELSADGKQLLPTGQRCDSDKQHKLVRAASTDVTTAGFAATEESVVVLPKPRWKMRNEDRRARLRDTIRVAMPDFAPSPPPNKTVGTYQGLCLPIQFPDVSSQVTESNIYSFCNQKGYSGNGNYGSVSDYFSDVSGGLLNYYTIVAPFYTALRPKGYYTDPSIPYGLRAQELIIEALAFHKRRGFDFTSLTVDGSNVVRATNVLYAGPVENNWSQGLWPHASTLTYDLGGRYAGDYQVTALDTAPTLGTYCHENGHMLCDLPDLYDYGSESSGVGIYCLMCAGGTRTPLNPTQICGYLKYRAGWARSVTRIIPGVIYNAFSGSNDFFVWERNSREYFIIENRQQSGRDAALTGSGLAIWHVDETGSNNNEQMTSSLHYECALMQADGRFDLERYPTNVLGDNSDLYPIATNGAFGAGTSPSSVWWDGTPSGLEITNIVPSGNSMTFTVNG